MKPGAKTRQYYETNITACWGGGVIKILETGDLLIAAKKSLKHGEFEPMAEAGLPFGPSVARCLMIIARDDRIRAHAHALPPCWTTLYELTKLTKLSAKAFDAALESRAIHPGMRRDDAVRLVAQERRKARPPIKAPNGYVASPEFRSATEDNIWYRGELERLSSVNCKQLVPEDGMTGVRADTARRNSSTWYSGKYSMFSGALAEAILLRYGGEEPKRVLDPFAGGARRGVVTEMMGHEYHGVDISKTIIEENRAICAGLGYHPHYYEGDAANLDCVQGKYGFMFTCPPYWNVETYSGHKNCFANAKKYEAFRGLLGDFARASRSKLEPGALACIVVADISWNGTLYDFPGHTMAAFAAAGFSCLNRIILIDAMGSGHKRKDRLWETAQKLVRRDQQILVFKAPNAEHD